MSVRSDIEIRFSNPAGAVRAREIAKTIIDVYVRNGYEYLRFDNMEKVNADGWIHYPERYERYEKLSAFRQLWTDYRKAVRFIRRNGVPLTPKQEEAVKLAGQIRAHGCRFFISSRSGMGDDRMIEHQYFQDFFSILCFLLSVVSPQVSFEGLYRSFEPESYAKRILTHAVYDGNALAFEQMEGDPVYGTFSVTWTREEDKYWKRSLRFPFIRVDIVTEERDAVRQDQDIEEWIRGVNRSAEGFNDAEPSGTTPAADDEAGPAQITADEARSAQITADEAGSAQITADEAGEPGDGRIQVGMASAELCFRHASYPYVMLHASTRNLCVKRRDDLLALLAEKGYRTELFSILYKGECIGEHIQIPDSVTAIGDDAFRKKTDLLSVVIPDSVVEIGEDAFRECISLEEIVIPDSVREIGSFAFSLCLNLKGVRLSGKLKKLKFGLFTGCRSLESIVIPEGVVEIEDCAFSGCTGLKRVVIPESVKEIGEDAFKGCNSLSV